MLFLTKLLAVSEAVEFSQGISLGGCRWPSSSWMRWMLFATFALMKYAPSLALVVEAATNQGRM